MSKRKWITILWMCIALCLITLWVLASRNHANALCTGVKVDMDGSDGISFISEKDIKAIITENGGAKGRTISNIKLNKLETVLKNNPWVADAKLFFDNSDALNVSIVEREPVARVFTLSGSSFFVDSACNMLPVIASVVVKLPVFTSFTSDRRKLSRPDSALLAQVKTVGQFVKLDTFWNSFIGQIDILPDKTFELTPIVGNTVIDIGNSDSLESKFDRLYSFYKQVWPKVGVNRYERINVAFDNQVVATRKGGAEAQAKDTSVTQVFTVSMAPHKKDIVHLDHPASQTVEVPQHKILPVKKAMIPVKKGTTKIIKK